MVLELLENSIVGLIEYKLSKYETNVQQFILKELKYSLEVLMRFADERLVNNAVVTQPNQGADDGG